MTTATAARERPILFSDPMTLALMDGRKTQTRRVIVPQPRGHTAWRSQEPDQWFLVDEETKTRGPYLRCPYGVPGDRLWVREAWQYADWTEDGSPFIRYRAGGATVLHDYGSIPEEWGERVLDIWADLSKPENYRIDNRAADRRWRPSIHMPRWASRITLEIVDVRVERLQDISIDDILAEGIKPDLDEPNYGQYWREATGARFVALWDSINAARGFGWDANPWVRALTFRRVGA